MQSRTGSEGIYFVIRQPEGWKLVAFRFDEHPDGGHPEFWEAYVTPMLVKAWAPRLFGKLKDAERHRRELALKAELDLHYDGFPRGRVTRNEEIGRFMVYHGANLKPAMKLTLRAIEQAFGITGQANWEFDDHEQCSTFSAEGVRSALGLREQWKTTIPDFD
jgi:hypothetical protein